MLARWIDNKSEMFSLGGALSLLGLLILGLIGLLYADLQVYALGVGLAMGMLGLVYIKPEFGLAILFFLAADVLYVNDFIDLRVLGGGLELRDLFLMTMWGIVLLRYRPLRFKRVITAPLSRWLLVFLLGCLFSAMWALVRFSVDLFYVLRELRAVASYSTFFLLLIVAQERKKLHFVVRYLTLLACILAVISIAQYIVGTELAFAGGRVEVRQATQGLTRVLLPSVFLVNAMMIINIAQLSFNHGPKSLMLRLPIIALLGAAVALTQSRNLWFSDGIVLLFFFLFSGLRRKIRFVVGFLLLVLLLGIGLSLLPTAREDITAVEGLRGRLMEPFERDLFKGSRTLGGRVQELEIAFEKIAQYPMLGIGLGNRYYEDGHKIWRYSEDKNFLPRFIHNGYAWVALKLGLPMFLLLLWILARALIWVGRDFQRAVTLEDQGLIVGLGLSLIGLCASALVVPIFMQPSYVVTLTVIMGLISAVDQALLSDDLKVKVQEILALADQGG